MSGFESIEASLLLARIFEWLDVAEIEYCVERNYQEYPDNLTGDLDLVVSDIKMMDAVRGIKTITKDMKWFCYQEHIWEKSAYLGFGKSIFPNRFALTVELFAGAMWHGIPYLSAPEILGQRLRYEILWCPRPAHQAIITSIHHLLYNGHVPVKYRNEVSALVRQDSDLFQSALFQAFGRKLAGDIFDHIITEDWDALPAKAREMKVALFLRGLLRQPFKMVSTFKQGYQAKRRLPKGVVLFVFGDGIQRRGVFCQALLEFANRWHLFVPPVRRIIGDGVKQFGRSEIRLVNQIVQSGGVAIVNCKEKMQVGLPLSYLAYRIDLDKYWITPNGASFANDAIAINIPNRTLESMAAQVWNFVLADRAHRHLR